MMREIINGMNAVSLRQAGGVYFVPASERDSLLRLRELITGIPQVTGSIRSPVHSAFQMLSRQSGACPERSTPGCSMRLIRCEETSAD
jgi:hypothetical protein